MRHLSSALMPAEQSKRHPLRCLTLTCALEGQYTVGITEESLCDKDSSGLGFVPGCSSEWHSGRPPRFRDSRRNLHFNLACSAASSSVYTSSGLSILPRSVSRLSGILIPMFRDLRNGNLQ